MSCKRFFSAYSLPDLAVNNVQLIQTQKTWESLLIRSCHSQLAKTTIRVPYPPYYFSV